MSSFVAALALQQLRDMEQLQRDFGRKPRRQAVRTARTSHRVHASLVRRWQSRPGQVVAR